jgi:hypothetical protein
MPVNATIVGLVLNTRDNPLPDGDTVIATIYTSPCGLAAPVSTNISAMVTGPNCFATGEGSFPVLQGSLLSVQIITSSGVGALSRGVAVTIFLTIP